MVGRRMQHSTSKSFPLDQLVLIPLPPSSRNSFLISSAVLKRFRYYKHFKRRALEELVFLTVPWPEFSFDVAGFIVIPQIISDGLSTKSNLFADDW